MKTSSSVLHFNYVLKNLYIFYQSPFIYIISQKCGDIV